MSHTAASCLAFCLCAGPAMVAGGAPPSLGQTTGAPGGGSATSSLQVSVKAFGAVGDGVADDTQAIASALASIDKDRGGTLHFPRGFYRVSSILLDGFNGLTLQGEVGTYFLCTTPGTLMDVVDCRYLKLDGFKFLGRPNPNPFQDATPAFSGLSAPARFVYLHERPSASNRRQSEFLAFSSCLFFHCAGTAVEIGDPAIGPALHQPSDVYFDDIKFAEVAIALKVSQVNSQGIYCRRFGGSSVAEAVFHLAAGDLFARDVQVSGLAATAYLLKVVQTRNDDVKRVIIENYWNETAPGGVVKTNVFRISDGLSLGLTRINTTGTTWPFDIQCKDTTVRLSGMDSTYSAGGSATAMLRVNQSTRLITTGLSWTLAGSPTCRFEVIDDQGKPLEAYATQQFAEPALPFTSATRENLLPGAGSFATLEDQALFGDGFNAFKVNASGDLEVDKRTPGALVAWTDYFPVEAGTSYAASVLLAEEPAGMGTLWSLFFYDQGGAPLLETNLSTGDHKLSGTWLAKAGVVTAPPGATLARVRVGTTGPGHLRYRHLKVERGRFVTPFAPGPARAARILLDQEPTSGFWKVGDAFQKRLPGGGLMGRICTTQGLAVQGAWTPGAAFRYGDLVTNDGRVYQCLSGPGRSGAKPPAHTSGTSSDGTLQWRFVSRAGQPTFQDAPGLR